MISTLISIELLDPDIAAIALYHENGDFYTGLYSDKNPGRRTAPSGSVDPWKNYTSVLDQDALKTLMSGNGQGFGTHLICRSTDMIMNGRVFGRAEVYFSDAHFKSVLFTRMLYMLLLVVGVSIVTFVITHQSIRRQVLRPIEMMSRVVRRFRKKDFSARTEIISQTELGTLSQDINAMADTIQQYSQTMEAMVAERTLQLVNAEKMAALGELLAGISHEVNTPVGTALTAASFLDHTNREFTKKTAAGDITQTSLDEYLATSAEALSLTLSNLTRAAELVQSFKKIASDRSSAEKRKFKIKEYIGDVVTSLSPRLKRTTHEVVIDCPDDMEIDSYPGEISQILTNFILNSLLHAFPETSGGVMKIQVRKGGTLIVLVFSDNGAGIPEEQVFKIFNPFYTTKRGSGGSGLGLSIVYNIVTQTLGGSIECGSEIGKGTTFTIIFPDGGPVE
jgi:signal transduction histidine kinase